MELRKDVKFQCSNMFGTWALITIFIWKLSSVNFDLLLNNAFWHEEWHFELTFLHWDNVLWKPIQNIYKSSSTFTVRDPHPLISSRFRLRMACFHPSLSDTSSDHCAKKWSFPLIILQQMWSNWQKTSDLFTITKEILNSKLNFVCSGHEYRQ